MNTKHAQKSRIFRGKKKIFEKLKLGRFILKIGLTLMVINVRFHFINKKLEK